MLSTYTLYTVSFFRAHAIEEALYTVSSLQKLANILLDYDSCISGLISGRRGTFEGRLAHRAGRRVQHELGRLGRGRRAGAALRGRRGRRGLGLRRFSSSLKRRFSLGLIHPRLGSFKRNLR